MFGHFHNIIFGTVLGICISYNSETSHISGVEDSNLSAWFYGRVIFAISQALQMKISWPDLQKKSFFLSLTANLVHDICQKCWPGLTLCIAADEFSKCLAAHDSAEWKKCISQISSTLYSIGGFLVFSYQNIHMQWAICN